MFDPEERRFAEEIRESVALINETLKRIEALLTPEEKPAPKKRVFKKGK
jgi:hypothetical protein